MRRATRKNLKRGRPAAWSFFVAKRLEELRRHLTWIPHLTAVAGAVAAFLLAPAVNSKHPPDHSLYGAWGAALIAVGVVLLVLDRKSENAHALRFLGVTTVVYWGLGIVAAFLGLLPLRNASFRFLFAVAVAGGAAVFMTFALVAATNIVDQRRAARKKGLDDLAGLNRD